MAATGAGPRGNRATFVLTQPGPAGCPPGTALAIAQDAAGTARGFLWVLSNRGPQQLPAVQTYRIVPGAAPGQSLMLNPQPLPPRG